MPEGATSYGRDPSKYSNRKHRLIPRRHAQSGLRTHGHRHPRVRASVSGTGRFGIAGLGEAAEPVERGGAACIVFGSSCRPATETQPMANGCRPLRFRSESERVRGRGAETLSI